MEKLNASPLPLPDCVVALQKEGDGFALSQALPDDWSSKRPEELTPGQFVEITRLIYSNRQSQELGRKVWRKLKHGI